MTEIDTIFFDVDGTIVDARVAIVNAVNHTMREMGFGEKPFDLIVSYIGTGVKDLIGRSLADRDEKLVEKGIDIFSSFYERHATDKASLYPHVKEVLEFFKNKRKFVLTNRYKKFADITLKAFGIRRYFEDIIAGDDENCLKPDPCVLDEVVSDFNVDKDKAIIVGDMAIDVQTGKNSKIKTCWVTYGLGKKEDVERLKPDYVIDDLIELKGIIK